MAITLDSLRARHADLVDARRTMLHEYQKTDHGLATAMGELELLIAALTPDPASPETAATPPPQSVRAYPRRNKPNRKRS